MSPSFVAAHEGRLEVLKVLYLLGANIHAVDINGTTPIYVAACQGHIDVIDFLVLHGGDVNVPNKHGITPVHVAAYQQRHDVLDALFRRCAFMGARDIYGRSPLDIVSKLGQQGNLTAKFLRFYLKLSPNREKAPRPPRLVKRLPAFVAPKSMPQAMKSLVSSMFNMFPPKKRGKQRMVKSQHEHDDMAISPQSPIRLGAGVTVSTINPSEKNSVRYKYSRPPPPPNQSTNNMLSDAEVIGALSIPSLRHGYINVCKKLLPALRAIRVPPPPPLPSSSSVSVHSDSDETESTGGPVYAARRPRRAPPTPVKLPNSPSRMPPQRPAPALPRKSLETINSPIASSLKDLNKSTSSKKSRRRLFLNEHPHYDSPDVPQECEDEAFFSKRPTRHPPVTPEINLSFSHSQDQEDAEEYHGDDNQNSPQREYLLSPIKKRFSLSLINKVKSKDDTSYLFTS